MRRCDEFISVCWIMENSIQFSVFSQRSQVDVNRRFFRCGIGFQPVLYPTSFRTPASSRAVVLVPHSRASCLALIFDRTKWEAVYFGKLGQPPIHPSVLCKVLLFALSRRIRSSRQIEYAVEHSIDFIWLTSGRKLDHSTLSEFRRKHEKELKDIYRQMIQLAISMGVAKLSELCIDGTKIRADTRRFENDRPNGCRMLQCRSDTRSVDSEFLERERRGILSAY